MTQYAPLHELPGGRLPPVPPGGAVLPRRLALLATLAVASCLSPRTAEPGWHVLYDGGFRLPHVRAWVSDLTRSESTPDGLHVVDRSAETGSGRLYYVDWGVDPKVGATVEARLKPIACEGVWGMILLVADGVHEEGVAFLPDAVQLARSGRRAPFAGAGGFHDYRVRIRGEDIHVWADDKLLIDGKGAFTGKAIKGRNRVGFGAASSTAKGEAVWQHVRFRGGRMEPPSASVPDAPGLAIRQGETRTIAPGARYLSMFKFADGSIAVSDKRSYDGGRTWQESPKFHVGACQLPDGEIVQLRFSTRRTEREGYFKIPLLRSTDNGASLTSEWVEMHIPRGTGGVGDNGTLFEGPVADHAIVCLPDGSLLAAMYGQFEGDRVHIPTMPDEWDCFKYRTFVVRSTDRGRTWEYLATVAYDPEVGLESFCEPDLLMLPSGDILCFMRTGGSGGLHTPLYLSRSSDSGKTWGEPRPIADRGVWPNSCRMQNGVIVCTYGRPGNWLCFSLDDGRTWTGHFCFHDGPSTSYNSVEQIAPDTILVVYDRQKLDKNGNMAQAEVGTVFTVERAATTAD